MFLILLDEIDDYFYDPDEALRIALETNKFHEVLKLREEAMDETASSHAYDFYLPRSVPLGIFLFIYY